MRKPLKEYSRAVTGIIAGAAILVACTPTERLPKFNSEQERKCYLTANAALPNDNYSLARKGDTFVEVVSIEGFVRDTRTSKVYESCMIQLWGDNAPNKLSATGTLRFTGEEQRIWDSLTPSEKDAAFQHIRNGGTLTSWAAQQ